MAEIEYFVDPDCKDHPKFNAVADLKVRLYSRDKQMAGEAAADMTLKEAVEKVRIKYLHCSLPDMCIEILVPATIWTGIFYIS